MTLKTSLGIWALGPVITRIDDAALREAQSRKDAIRAYEIVYKALGA